MVEQDTVNIHIYVRFILGASFNKYIRRVSSMVELSVSATMIQVQVLYTFNKVKKKFFMTIERSSALVLS